MRAATLCLVVASSLAGQAADAGASQVLFEQATSPQVGIPAGGPYVPPGSLFDNEQSNGVTSLASQNSSGTLTARTADDFTIPAGACASGLFNISGIRIQIVQADAAPQPFAVDLYNDNGLGTAPTPAGSITPINTFAQTSQTALGAFGAGTTIFEASFNTPGLQLSADTIYWLSGYGATAASNPAAFNNFFATSNGFGATTDNGVIIAPGAGVATWTPVPAVIGGPPLAFSFAIDGTCGVLDADVSLTKIGSANGSQVTYTLTATNNGPEDATGVVVTDNFPVGLTYVSDDCGGVNGSPWTWNIGNLANTASVVCNITLTADAPGAFLNIASITSTNPDPVPANNSSTASVVAEGEGVPGIPTLSGLGLAALLALIAGAAVVALRRRG